MQLKIRRVENKVGDVKISGAKNSALPIICASLLSDEEVTLENVPNITDCNTVLSILTHIGFNVVYQNNIAKITRKKKINPVIKDEDVKKMRGSYYFMGALLSKVGKVTMANSGGCDLGYRPINYHLDGFQKMGAKVTEKNGLITIQAKKLLPSNITLEFPSVGATINLMLASVKTDGLTIINNCAKEPEIEDVANFLNAMGAKIKGAGSKVITIEGVSHLKGVTYRIMCDRIEAGTYLILGALLDGATIRGVRGQHLSSLISLLRDIGYPVSVKGNNIIIDKPNYKKSFSVVIGTFPAFPTDLGQPLSVLGTQIDGTCVIKETIFKKRYSHVEELNKMGAKIRVVDDSITIDGKTPLTNQQLKAYDLRGAAALVLAASTIDQYSFIDNIDVFLRGYENPVEKLASFGIEAHLIQEIDGEKDVL